MRERETCKHTKRKAASEEREMEGGREREWREGGRENGGREGWRGARKGEFEGERKCVYCGMSLGVIFCHNVY